jgi:hypothetical protein
MERKPSAKVRPMSGFHLDLVDAHHLILGGLFDCYDVDVRVLICVITA